MCSVQFSRSVVSDSATPWTAARQASLSITNSRSLLRLTSIKSVVPSNHLILHHPLLLLPSVFPSIRVFSNESVLHIRWPKYWSFSFSISPSNEYSGLISFRMDWLDLLAPRDSQDSSLTPHFKSINSLVLSFLYSPALHAVVCRWNIIPVLWWWRYLSRNYKCNWLQRHVELKRTDNNWPVGEVMFEMRLKGTVGDGWPRGSYRQRRRCEALSREREQARIQAGKGDWMTGALGPGRSMQEQISQAQKALSQEIGEAVEGF